MTSSLERSVVNESYSHFLERSRLAGRRSFAKCRANRNVEIVCFLVFGAYFEGSFRR